MVTRTALPSGLIRKGRVVGIPSSSACLAARRAPLICPCLNRNRNPHSRPRRENWSYRQGVGYVHPWPKSVIGLMHFSLLAPRLHCSIQLSHPSYRLRPLIIGHHLHLNRSGALHLKITACRYRIPPAYLPQGRQGGLWQRGTRRRCSKATPRPYGTSSFRLVPNQPRPSFA